MPSLKDVVKAAHGMKATAALPADHPDKVLAPYVVPRRLEWLARPERERAWTPEAIAFAQAVLAGEFKHERSHRISPSSMGAECERELLFGYGGAPQLPRPVANEEKMDSGTFSHLRWQMAGLSAGWLAEGEVWVHSEALRCGGSMDGICDDGSLFELKNTAPHLFTALRDKRGSAYAYAVGMHHKHLLQAEAYFILDSLQPAPRLNGLCSLVYQDEASKDTYEVRFASNEARRNEVHRILEGLHDWIDLDELPDMLEGCRKIVSGELTDPKAARRYGQCPYREYCPDAHSVTVG